MRIGGFVKISLIDFPGKVAAVVFTCGCDLRCRYCQNPTLVKGCPPGEVEKIPERVIFDYLKKNKALLDGVTITGGEPTLQPDLKEFIKKVKSLGLKVKLDTNGMHPEVLKEVLPLVDYVAMDIKAPPNKYKEITGVKVELKRIEESMKIIRESGVEYEFRTTVVPGLLTKKDIKSIAKWIGKAKRYSIQGFVPHNTLDKKLMKIKPYSRKELEEIREEVKDYFQICEIKD